MSEKIVVFDFIEPRQKLMSWFLSDSGLRNSRVTSFEEAELALRAEPRPRVLIVNSTAENAAFAAVVAQIRAADGGHLRIVILHGGKHRETDGYIDADICRHEVRSVEDLVEVVQAALDDDVPEIEPHAAGRVIAEEAS